jgi:pimeloyl-ACP methyl ester carboxylesterase
MFTPTPTELSRGVPTRLGRLHVRAAGSGPATVLWPSMFVDGRTFDPLLPLLPGRRLVVVDGPGLGASEPLRRRSTIAEAADAAQDLLTGPDAAGLGLDGPVDWVGNAFGGHVGYELARRPGVLRSLAAVSAPTEPVPPALRRQIGLLGPLLRVLGPVGPVREAILSALLTDASAADPTLRAAVLDSVGAPTRRSLSLALRSFILDRVDVTSGLAEIAIPCLFVAGDDRGDWTPEAAAAAAALTPSASAVTIPGSRTLLPLEQPQALARELLAFWSRG